MLKYEDKKESYNENVNFYNIRSERERRRDKKRKESTREGEENRKVE